MKKLYLITGATGHLGSVLVQKLLAKGCDVRALVLPGEEGLVPPGVRTVAGDIVDPGSLTPFFEREGYDRVVLLHCAAIITIAAREDPRVWDTNVNGTANLLEAARKSGVDRVVCVNSVHAIPELPSPAVIREPDTFSPDLVHGQYAKSKAAAAALVLRAAAEGLDVSLVHPSGIIGPGDQRGGNNMIRTLRAMAAGKIPAVVPGGYDFVDVRDVADGILACEVHGKRGECYILSGHYATVRELLQTVCGFVGRRVPSIRLPACLARFAAAVAESFASLFRRRTPILTRYSVYTLQTNARFSHEKAKRTFGYRVRDLRASIRASLLPGQAI